MELLRVVDKLGNDTNEIIEREELHNRGKLHNEVTIYIVNDKGEVLLQRRSKNRRFCPNKLGVIAGHQSYREDILTCAVRETKEEVGLKIEENSTALFDCKESIEFEIFPHFRYKYAPNVTHCHEHWFLLAVEQEFEPILSEHLACQWVSPEHAIQMTKSPNNAEAIKKYLMNGFPL